jgi:hypothetical protein
VKLVRRQRPQEADVPKDFAGHEIVTAADLDAMGPAERQASAEEALILDPTQLPAAFRERTKAHFTSLIAERDREQAAARGTRREQ